MPMWDIFLSLRNSFTESLTFLLYTFLSADMLSLVLHHKNQLDLINYLLDQF